MNNDTKQEEDLLGCPAGLTEPIAILAIDAVCQAMREDGLAHTGGRAFYSPAEWKALGHEIDGKALFYVVYEGSDLGLFMDYDQAQHTDYVHLEKMSKALAKVGVWFEPDTTVHGAMYRLDKPEVDKIVEPPLPRPIQPGVFDTFVTISFYNTAMREHYVWICETLAVALHHEMQLNEKEHITHVHLNTATVKRTI
jgi:hypothetical protein